MAFGGVAGGGSGGTGAHGSFTLSTSLRVVVEIVERGVPGVLLVPSPDAA